MPWVFFDAKKKIKKERSLKKYEIQACCKCGAKDNLHKGRSFIKNAIRRTYLMCRACTRREGKAYRRTKKGKIASYKLQVKYSQRNKEKRLAWNAAKDLPKKPCELCGSTEFIHKHHEDYSKPLDVVYLCAAHHKELHDIKKLSTSGNTSLIKKKH